MVYVLDEERVERAQACDPASDPDFSNKLGTGNLRLIDRAAILLAYLADLLARRNFIAPGPGVGLYCIVGAASQDLALKELTQDATAKQIMTAVSALPPTRTLKFMPVAQAFWSARIVGAEGPVRVFSYSGFAETQATRQAEMDLDVGACDVAFVLGVTPDCGAAWGKVLGRKQGCQ
ncbi:MAG: hypothetical protein ACXWQO_05110 [Bdellovibrionota bacterium]